MIVQPRASSFAAADGDERRAAYGVGVWANDEAEDQVCLRVALQRREKVHVVTVGVLYHGVALAPDGVPGFSVTVSQGGQFRVFLVHPGWQGGRRGRSGGRRMGRCSQGRSAG